MSHCRIGERINCNDMKMSQTSWRYFLTATSRRTHCSPNLNILYVEKIGFLAIIPLREKEMYKTTVQLCSIFLCIIPLVIIKILPEKFKTWLRSISFFSWHVKVVNKNQASTTSRWSIDTFFTSIQSTQNQILSIKNQFTAIYSL